VVDHDKDVLRLLFETQAKRLKEADRLERELRDHAIALQMLHTNVLDNLSFGTMRILFRP
jgi:hypothetical protein